MSAFGFGYSTGQFWYGKSTGFPGFLYKKHVGVGGRRSTKMTPGGNITCNIPTNLYNKYKPGTGGIGASSTSNRRAKNRLATVCNEQKCFPCYTTLGQYSNYTHNPNGYVNCLPCPSYSATGEYTLIPRNKTYNTILKYTGNGGTFMLYNDSLILLVQILIIGETEPFYLTQNVKPGSYPINPNLSNLEYIILYFNVC